MPAAAYPYPAEALAQQGWALIEDPDPSAPLVGVAARFGRPIPSRDGVIEKVLTPMTQDTAVPNSMSAIYGLGELPFHTDTAHWPSPARFVVIRARANPGSVPTRLLDSRQFLSTFKKTADLRTGVWRAVSIRSQFVCSLLARWNGVETFRWDPCCLVPVGPRAEGAHWWLKHDLEQLEPDAFASVVLQPGHVLVIDNHRVLHARAKVPKRTATHRALERVVVGGN